MQQPLQQVNPLPSCRKAYFSAPLEHLRLFGPHLKQDHTLKEQQYGVSVRKAFAIFNKSQAGKTEIIKKDRGEMLVAIALDKPLEVVENPTRLIAEIMQILEDKQAHPVLAQMVNPDVRDDQPISELASASSASGSSQPEKNPMIHMRGFSESTQQPRYCQRGRPTTGSILQDTPIANHRKYFPCKSQPTWDTHGWFGARTHATSTRLCNIGPKK